MTMMIADYSLKRTRFSVNVSIGDDYHYYHYDSESDRPFQPIFAYIKNINQWDACRYAVGDGVCYNVVNVEVLDNKKGTLTI